MTKADKAILLRLIINYRKQHQLSTPREKKTKFTDMIDDVFWRSEMLTHPVIGPAFRKAKKAKK